MKDRKPRFFRNVGFYLFNNEIFDKNGERIAGKGHSVLGMLSALVGMLTYYSASYDGSFTAYLLGIVFWFLTTCLLSYLVITVRN